MRVKVPVLIALMNHRINVAGIKWQLDVVESMQ